VRKVNTTVEALERIVGARRPAMMMKAISELDEGSRRVVDAAPIAAFGYRDTDGRPNTTFVGGAPGFARIETPAHLRFDWTTAGPAAAAGTGASLLFLLPGIGETLRANGTVTAAAAGSVGFELDEAFVHCAKCILRSKLWSRAPTVDRRAAAVIHDRAAPLSDAGVRSFLDTSPFVVITSWNAAGASTTSPRGDDPGFVRVLDGHTLAIPDRKGNTRTDTFHNLLECDEVSLASIVPGWSEVLHLAGRAYVTDDTELRSTMSVSGDSRPPNAALVVHVEQARIVTNEALDEARLWDGSAVVDPAQIPDLMQLSAKHLAASKTRGASAAATRVLSRTLARAPRLLRRGVDHGYDKDLTDEGYEGRR